jgi:signal transduction histidine kinase
MRKTRNQMESSARFMKFMVQDLLDFAQIRAGKFRINKKRFNIRETVASVMSIQESQAKIQGVSLRAEFKNMSMVENP